MIVNNKTQEKELVFTLYSIVNRNEARKSGAIEAITNMMKIYINDVDICLIGCSVLMDISMNGKRILVSLKQKIHLNNTADNKIWTEKGGRAIKVILDAMNTHINNAKVCENGCWILNIATTNGN